MSIKIKTALIGALMLVSGMLVSGSAALAREPNALHALNRGAGTAVDTTRLPWQAPVGHRQPRAENVSGGTQVSSLGEEQRRLEMALAAKLTICRGC